MSHFFHSPPPLKSVFSVFMSALLWLHTTTMHAQNPAFASTRTAKKMAVEITVKGRVTDATTKEGLVGCSVVLKGT